MSAFFFGGGGEFKFSTTYRTFIGYAKYLRLTNFIFVLRFVFVKTFDNLAWLCETIQFKILLVLTPITPAVVPKRNKLFKMIF